MEFKRISRSSTHLKNRREVSLKIAGLAPGGRKVHVPFLCSFLRGSRGSMASPRQRRCVWRFAATERRPRAARRWGQRGLQSRFGCRTKCGSLGWWFRIWNWSKDCRSICPAFFQLSPPKGRSRRRKSADKPGLTLLPSRLKNSARQHPPQSPQEPNSSSIKQGNIQRTPALKGNQMPLAIADTTMFTTAFFRRPRRLSNLKRSG